VPNQSHAIERVHEENASLTFTPFTKIDDGDEPGIRDSTLSSPISSPIANEPLAVDFSIPLSTKKKQKKQGIVSQISVLNDSTTNDDDNNDTHMQRCIAKNILLVHCTSVRN
jgi:hypothetical protein